MLSQVGTSPAAKNRWRTIAPCRKNCAHWRHGGDMGPKRGETAYALRRDDVGQNRGIKTSLAGIY